VAWQIFVEFGDMFISIKGKLMGGISALGSNITSRLAYGQIKEKDHCTSHHFAQIMKC